MPTLTTTIRYALPYALTLVLCGCTTVYQHSRPAVVTFEIEVEGQWRTMYRTVYTYPDDDLTRQHTKEK